MARPQHAITQKDPAWILDCLQARDAPHSKQERDDEQVLSGFTDEQNDAALLIGWYDYAQARKDEEIMGDSGTDARPLILGWCKSP